MFAPFAQLFVTFLHLSESGSSHVVYHTRLTQALASW
jgi:hypothetical protein